MSVITTLCVFANWPIDTAPDSLPVKVVGEVQYFIQASLAILPRTDVTVLLAYVHWFRNHTCDSRYGSGFTVCDPVAPKIISCYSFLPLHRVLGRCAHIKIDVDFGEYVDDVFVACHLLLKLQY